MWIGEVVDKTPGRSELEVIAIHATEQANNQRQVSSCVEEENQEIYSLKWYSESVRINVHRNVCVNKKMN